MNDNIKVIEIIIAGLVGLGSKYGIDFFTSRKKESRVDFSTIVARLDKELEENKKERKILIEHNKQLEEKVFRLQAELMSIRNKIILLESAQNYSPLPMWLKDTDGTMLALNDAYLKLFLKPNKINKNKYIGRTDFDVWPEHIAREYIENDSSVLTQKEVFRGYETVIINGEEEKWRILKYPRYIGDTVIGIAGVAIPEKWESGFFKL